MNISDEKIIEDVLGGNVTAYGKLVEKYKDKVYTLALRILRNREDAEEAAQDAFIKCYYALPDFKFESAFSTWLYKIVYTSAISSLRKKTKKDIAFIDFDEEDYNLSDINNALINFKEEEQKRFLQDAMQILLQEENTIIFLYYQADKSIDEISKITELTKSNIKVKLYRARQKLFLELKKLLKKEVYDLI